PVLREAHGPAGDNPRRSRNQLICLVDEGSIEASCGKQRITIQRCKVMCEFLESNAVLVDERAIDPAIGNKAAVEQLEEGQVSPYGNRQVQVGQDRTRTDKTAERLWIPEPQQSGLGQRIDGHNPR